MELKSLALAYDTHSVLNGIDLRVGPHETVAILASAGAGKSALFRTLIGLEPPTAGQVFWFGRNVEKLRPREKLLLRRHIGAVHHGGALFSDLTVTENIKLPMVELTNLGEEQINSTVRLMLTVAGLYPFRDLYPSALSSVMLHLAALARALVLGPELLICDDIFSGLDTRSQRQIDRSLRALHILRGRATVILTHNVKMAFQLADRIAVLADGLIVADGPPEAILASTLGPVRAMLDDEVENENADTGALVRQVTGRQ